jgi:hypothetical protein
VANAARFGAEEFRRTLPEVVEQTLADARGETFSERSGWSPPRARNPRSRGLGLAAHRSDANARAAGAEGLG